MPDQPSPPARRALTTWKEIAAFFSRDVRTVQRWEKEEGLPVQRHFHQRKSSVYAEPEALQLWWRERGARLVETHSAAQESNRRWIWLGWAGTAAAVLFTLVIFARLYRRAEVPGNVRFLSAVLRASHPQFDFGRGLIADLNADGKGDIVLTAFENRSLHVVFGGQLSSLEGELAARSAVVIHGTKNASYQASQAADFNGDGIKDLLISEILNEPDTFHSTGFAYLLWGRRQWPKNLALPADADSTLQLAWPGDVRMIACKSSTSRGDLNADGIEEILLGATEFTTAGRRSAGAVFVLFGRKNWPRNLEVLSSADVTIRGSRTGEGLGQFCETGDWDGDKQTDLALYAHEYSLWNLLGGRGRTYVFRGRATWPRRLDAQSNFSLRIDGQRPNALRVSLLFADVNGDGSEELVTSTWAIEGSSVFPGEVCIWSSKKSRNRIVTTADADAVIEGEVPNGGFGSGFASSDLDGDGLTDLLISEPRSGLIHALYGRRNWKPRGRLSEYSPIELFHAGVGAGLHRLAVEDVDGDQQPEIVFSDPRDGSLFPVTRGLTWIVKPSLSARLDVRPDSEPNILYIPDGIAVARLFGFSREDSQQIEASSIRLAGATAQQVVRQDFNGDGIIDLQLYFETSKMRISPDTTRVALAARTRAGLPVSATDAVVVMLQADANRVQAKSASTVPNK